MCALAQNSIELKMKFMQRRNTPVFDYFILKLGQILGTLPT